MQSCGSVEVSHGKIRVRLSIVYTVAGVNAVYTYTVANAATRYVVDIVAVVFSAYN